MNFITYLIKRVSVLLRSPIIDQRVFKRYNSNSLRLSKLCFTCTVPMNKRWTFTSQLQAVPEHPTPIGAALLRPQAYIATEAQSIPVLTLHLGERGISLVNSQTKVMDQQRAYLPTTHPLQVSLLVVLMYSVKSSSRQYLQST